MTPFADIERDIAAAGRTDATSAAARLLAAGEAVLENWIEGRGQRPGDRKKEGFRLLALHAQGARGEPSFNACRETCRELVYHYNLITMEPAHPDTARRLELMSLIARHLLLFVSGKMQVDNLGEFCCASKPIRLESGVN